MTEPTMLGRFEGSEKAADEVRSSIRRREMAVLSSYAGQDIDATVRQLVAEIAELRNRVEETRLEVEAFRTGFEAFAERVRETCRTLKRSVDGLWTSLKRARAYVVREKGKVTK